MRNGLLPQLSRGRGHFSIQIRSHLQRVAGISYSVKVGLCHVGSGGEGEELCWECTSWIGSTLGVARLPTEQWPSAWWDACAERQLRRVQRSHVEAVILEREIFAQLVQNSGRGSCAPILSSWSSLTYVSVRLPVRLLTLTALRRRNKESATGV